MEFILLLFPELIVFFMFIIIVVGKTSFVVELVFELIAVILFIAVFGKLVQHRMVKTIIFILLSIVLLIGYSVISKQKIPVYRSACPIRYELTNGEKFFIDEGCIYAQRSHGVKKDGYLEYQKYDLFIYNTHTGQYSKETLEAYEIQGRRTKCDYDDYLFRYAPDITDKWYEDYLSL